MDKILLVYEDYADLMEVESTLKKVGFNVLGLSSEYAVAEQILAFNPDVVVGAGRGGKVSSTGVGKRLKEMNRWAGKVVLIFQANSKPDPQELLRLRVDMLLEAPVTLTRLVQVLGNLLEQDEEVLLGRLHKTLHVDTSARGSGSVIVGGTVPEGEAIFVKGSVPSSEHDSSSSEISEGPSISPERVFEDSASEPLNQASDKEGALEFKFGDRLSEVTTVREQEERESSSQDVVVFPDVDISALEREILGGGVPEVEKVEVTSVAESKLEASLADRIAKYADMVKDVKVSPKSTVTRVEARRRNKQLKADLDSQNDEEQDELRRNFAKALFKK